jgi:hypothetical protein
MANPTSNYGWVLPNSADLVTDLPADFDVALQGVDTSLKALNPATTLGDIQYRSATANTNTRLPIGTTGQVLSVVAGVPAWTTGTTGDIEGVTAGVGISGGGTSGTVTVTNSMATTITTNGDLIYGTGSGTFTRLGIGSTGQALTVSGGVPTWAAPVTGGMTLISTTTLGSTTTTISSIPSGYNQLFVVFQNMTTGSAGTAMKYQFNSDSGTNYIYRSGAGNQAFTKSSSFGWDFGNVYASSSPYAGTMTIDDYTATTRVKPIMSNFVVQTGVTPDYSVNISQGAYFGTSAITSMTITTFSGAGTITGTVLLYGVK